MFLSGIFGERCARLEVKAPFDNFKAPLILGTS